MTDPGYAEVLRKSADDFLIVAAVTAERDGRPPLTVVMEALADAQARLTETGALSNGGDDDLG